jgi:hypothetical protein
MVSRIGRWKIVHTSGGSSSPRLRSSQADSAELVAGRLHLCRGGVFEGKRDRDDESYLRDISGIRGFLPMTTATKFMIRVLSFCASCAFCGYALIRAAFFRRAPGWENAQRSTFNPQRARKSMSGYDDQHPCRSTPIGTLAPRSSAGTVAPTSTWEQGGGGCSATTASPQPSPVADPVMRSRRVLPSCVILRRPSPAKSRRTNFFHLPGRISHRPAYP